MTPVELSAAVRAAVSDAITSGELDVELPADVRIERAKSKDHGDYATNVALQLAKSAGRPPREVASTIADRLRHQDGIATVDVAGPGFINIRLAESALGEVARTVVSQGPSYGQSNILHGQRLNLEFVSANPTGPVHIGAVRWAAVGDSLGRLLEASGAAVTREYYFNDAGAQLDRFAESLEAAARGQRPPPDGYAGEYINDLAGQILAGHPDLLERSDAIDVFRRDGVQHMLDHIKQSLAGFGVHFDVYFLERSLHESGAVQQAVDRLRLHGHVYDADGAVWLRTTDFGDDRDRVLIRQTGEPTYFAADTAYYLNKRDRGFDRVIIMLGADHHGYIGRMRAMVRCYDEDPDQHLEILIGQLVNLIKNGEPVRMSKRAGNVITLEDLVEAVGVDAARYALARSSTDSMIDLDLDLLTKQAEDNPVYYVQYAHARICSLLRNAEQLGIHRGPDYDPALLSSVRENDLLRELAEFPELVSRAAQSRQPHQVARYLEALAGTYHKFYDDCRVLPYGDESPTDTTSARLWLCEATRTVLANGLLLLGVGAPERM